MLNLPAIQREKSVLSDLLEAFQPNKIPDSVLSDIQPNILPGTVEYLYLGAYSYIESVLNTGINSDMFSFCQCSLIISVIIFNHIGIGIWFLQCALFPLLWHQNLFLL